MSKFERLLVPGSTEAPDCRCGVEMRLVRASPEGEDAEIRYYLCPVCGQDFRLTVWTETSDTPERTGSI